MKRSGMDDSLVGAILGLSSEDVRSLVYEADPQVELGGGGGGGGDVIQVAETTMTHDDIMSLIPGQVEIVAAPGPGAIVDLVYLKLLSSIVSSFGYDGVDANALLRATWDATPSLPVALCYESTFGGVDTLSDLLAASRLLRMPMLGNVGDPAQGLQPVATEALETLEDLPITLDVTGNGAGNFTDGHPDNTILVVAGYVTIQVP